MTCYAEGYTAYDFQVTPVCGEPVYREDGVIDLCELRSDGWGRLEQVDCATCREEVVADGNHPDLA